MTKKQMENINHEMWLAMDAVETWTKRANDTKMEDRKKRTKRNSRAKKCKS